MKWILFTLMFMAIYGLLWQEEWRCQARVNEVAAQLEMEVSEALKGMDRYNIKR